MIYFKKVIKSSEFKRQKIAEYYQKYISVIYSCDFREIRTLPDTEGHRSPSIKPSSLKYVRNFSSTLKRLYKLT